MNVASSLLNRQFIDPLGRLREPPSVGSAGLQPKRASKAGAPAAAPNETPEERLQRLINTGAPTMQFSASADDSAPVSPPSSPRLAAKMPGFSLQPTVVDRIAPTQLVKYRIVADNTPVMSRIETTSTEVATLQPGMLVEVCDIQNTAERVRARIISPPGWISISSIPPQWVWAVESVEQ